MTNLTFPIRRMPRLALVLVAVSTVLALSMAVPAVATEASEAPAQTEAPAEGATDEGTAADGEENGKLTISSNPHDQFGLVLFGLMGLAGLAMGLNAIRQLRGERPSADGRYRWR